MVGVLMAKPKRVTDTPRKIRKLLTTGDIGKMMGLASRTIADWIDQGVLEAVRFPDEKNAERRVYRGVWRAYCEKMGYYWALAEMDEEEGLDPTPMPTPDPKAAPVIPPKPHRAAPVRKKK